MITKKVETILKENAKAFRDNEKISFRPRSLKRLLLNHGGIN